MAIDGGKILAYLELDTSGYTSAMASAQRQMNEAAAEANLTRKVQSMGRAAQSVGGALVLGVTTPLLGAGAAAAKTAITFESAFAGVRKTVDATEAEYQALSDGILAMSERIPQSAADLAGMMEIAGQLGVSKDDLLSFTEVIANLGVATNLTGEEAATMLAQYANIMNMPLSDVDKLGSVIVDLGNNCATTERDIAEMAQRLAGEGGVLNLSNTQVMALAATMASLGINAEAGGSAMSRVLQKMNTAVLDGGDDLSAFAGIANRSAEDFAAGWLRDPLEALGALLDGLGQLQANGGDVTAALTDVGLSDLRVVDTMQRLANASGLMNANLTLANGAWEDNNALQNEADKRYETTESQMQLAKNSVENAAAAVGDSLLPYITQAAQAVAELAQGFSELDEDTQQTALTIAALAAAAGPVMTLVGTLTSPLGLVAALGLAGYAAVKAFSDAKQAAVQAGLAERFGDISLSAQEMDEIVAGLFSGAEERHLPLTAALDEAQTALQEAIRTFDAQTLTLDKLVLKAALGLEISPEDLTAAAAQLAADAKDAIEAQQVTANLAVDAVFGADDPEGAALKERFNAYYSQADAEAKQKGEALAAAIEAGMRDGFLDETEQETINALRQELAQITSRALSVDTQGALLRFQMEAEDIELTPDSLTGLMERAQTAAQAGLDEISQNGELLLTATYNMAAAEDWSEDKLREEITRINAQVADNLRDFDADVQQKIWSAVGSRVTGGFSTEIEQAAEKLPLLLQQAVADADSWADFNGVDRGSERYVNNLMQNIGFAFGEADWDGILGADGRRQAQTMYAAMAPTHETLQQLADEMGNDFPPLLQEALTQLDMMQLLTMDSGDASQVFKSYLWGIWEEASGDMEGAAAGVDLGQQLLDGLSSADLGTAAADMLDPALDAVSGAAETFQTEGGNAATGYARGMTGGTGEVENAAAGLARAAIASMRRAQDSHSPSRKFKTEGYNAVMGYAGGMDANVAYHSAKRMAQSAQRGAASVSLADKISGGVNAAAALSAEAAQRVAAAERRKKAAEAAARAQAAAEEAARRAALIQSIQETGAAALAEDAANYQRRMAQIASETSALMDFAGQHSIWYQQDKGTAESAAVRERYDALIAQEDADYETRKAALEGQKEQLAALKSYHDQRLTALKEQRDAEVNAARELYDTQKQMALDWLDRQGDLLQQELDAKQAAYDEEDYQQELTDLRKRQRQTKSAREKRELQEEIDRKERDHALEQQRTAMQETLAGYAALREAIQSGLIGLGDLTGNSAFGDLSFGTAGLDKLDTITGQLLQNVLQSLDRSALASGTSATVSAAQLAAALASAGQASSPLTVQKEGNHYSIDLRGCVVRDESDIDAIVDKLEARMRAAGR